MKSKCILTIVLISGLIFGGAAAKVYAFEKGDKEHHWDLEEKFTGRLKMILSNKDALGLSEEQIKNVKDLKMKTKKDLIRMDAEIDVTRLDIESAMWDETADTETINKLIDKKYDLKKEKAKSLVAACNALKGILTKEQNDKMKEMCKEHKKEMHGATMKGKMKSCDMMKNKDEM